jgi:23S rRNA (uridine2552-2'-O)-methyltransferase
VARYQPKDRFFKKAKEEGLRARSAFKLEELLHKVGARGLRGGNVLDLGAAPGGWLQIFSRIVGPQGLVVGLDLVPIAPLAPNVKTLVGDIHDPTMLAQLQALAPGGFGAVTSDMAPKTTGIAATDCARSLELVELAFAMAGKMLRPGGTFLAKAFMGPDLDPFVKAQLQPAFEKLQRVRPEATREGSREIYLCGVGYRPPPATT